MLWKGVGVGSSICCWGGWGPEVRVKDDSKFLPVSSSRDGNAFTEMEKIVRQHTGGKRSSIGALNVLFDTPVRSKKSYLTCAVY